MSDDKFNLYDQLKKYPVLKKEEFAELHDEWKKTGSKQLFDKLVNHNLGLIISIVGKKQFIPDGYGREDLAQSGFFGLKRAIEKFDPSMGFTFSTYATHWIRQSIQRDIENNKSTIRVPIYIQRVVNNYFKAINSIESTNPSPQEIYDWCIANKVMLLPKTTPESIRKDLAEYNKLKAESTDQIGMVSDEAVSILDSYTPVEEDVTKDLNLEKVSSTLKKALFESNITQRERTVLCHRFGFLGHDPMTLIELGYTLGVTREMVRQIQLKGLMKLKAKIAFEDVAEALDL